jgi:hypothetical protein
MRPSLHVPAESRRGGPAVLLEQAVSITNAAVASVALVLALLFKLDGLAKGSGISPAAGRQFIVFLRRLAAMLEFIALPSIGTAIAFPIVAVAAVPMCLVGSDDTANAWFVVGPHQPQARRRAQATLLGAWHIAPIGSDRQPS